jgi:hypothetical protein
VSFLVDSVRGLGAWRLDQTEDDLALLVDPVASRIYAMFVLHLQILGMGFCDGLGGGALYLVMHVEVEGVRGLNSRSIQRPSHRAGRRPLCCATAPSRFAPNAAARAPRS